MLLSSAYNAMRLCVCTQSCPALCEPVDCSLLGSSVLRVFQARILEWVAMTSSRGIFLTQRSNPSLLWLLPCRQILYRWAAREAPRCLLALWLKFTLRPDKFLLFSHLRKMSFPCQKKKKKRKKKFSFTNWLNPDLKTSLIAQVALRHMNHDVDTKFEIMKVKIKTRVYIKNSRTVLAEKNFLMLWKPKQLVNTN